jgi:2-keto-3-deoxy-L-fuconate dehydrogenase
MFSLTDKTAIITGGGSGIGRAIAELFASQGANVFILELNTTPSEEIVRKIKSSGAQAAVVECNVTDQKRVLDVCQEIADQTGSIDILVNCAGISHIGKLENTSEADFEKLFQVNVKGVYNGMAGVISQMKKQKRGVILNMCSIAASVGLADRFAYSMTKGAVFSMTLSVAKDYVKDNIRCNCISPARVHTPFVDGFLKANYPGKEEEMFEKLSKTQPIGRMGRPEEVASLALYLCSDQAAFVTGTDYPLDGGFIKLNT